MAARLHSHRFLPARTRIAVAIRRRLLLAAPLALGAAVALRAWIATSPTGAGAVSAVVDSQTGSARGDAAATGAEGSGRGTDLVSRADAAAVRFGECVLRGELDAALALWPELDAGTREPAWRAIVARWLQARPTEGRALAEAARAQAAAGEFSAVIDAWADADPRTLAEYALQLPVGEARGAALDAAVRGGVARDPAAVAAWLPRLAEPAEFDRAAAYLVAHTDPLFRPTAQALEWARLIRDPARRGDALAAVVREWSAREPARAAEFAAQADEFSPEQRAALLASLTPRPEPQ